MNKLNSNQSCKLLAISGLALALAFCGLPASAQQEQANIPGYPVGNGQQPSDNSASGNPNSPAGPGAYPNAPAQDAAPPNSVSPGPAAPTGPVPASLTVPVGTIIQIRTNEWLSTDRNLPGDGFNATLVQPIIVNGWVVARGGQNVLGRVTMSQKANSSNNHASQLGLQLSELTFVDGQLLPIQTQLLQNSAPADHSRDVGVVGSTTGVGAVVGAIAGGGTGAAVGAGIGAIAGLGVITTHGRPTAIPPETLLSFQLQAPVTISTDKSQAAFRPITQTDYNANNGQRRNMREGAYPPPPPPYYGYPYAYSPYYYPYYGYGFYPGPLYLGFGYGPRFYGRFGRFR